MVADTTKYVLLAANNSLQSVVHVREKSNFKKLCSKYEKIQSTGIFAVTFGSHAEHSESMMAVLVRRFYDVSKYKISLQTAKRSSRINGSVALLCPSQTALVAA